MESLSEIDQEYSNNFQELIYGNDNDGIKLIYIGDLQDCQNNQFYDE